MVKKSLSDTDGTPDFPGKKFFGNMDPAFLTQRGQAIQHFLNLFLSHKHVKASQFVPIYFMGKAASPEDAVSIEELALFMSGNKSNKN